MYIHHTNSDIHIIRARTNHGIFLTVKLVEFVSRKDSSSIQGFKNSRCFQSATFQNFQIMLKSTFEKCFRVSSFLIVYPEKRSSFFEASAEVRLLMPNMNTILGPKAGPFSKHNCWAIFTQYGGYHLSGSTALEKKQNECFVSTSLIVIVACEFFLVRTAKSARFDRFSKWLAFMYLLLACFNRAHFQATLKAYRKRAFY